MTKKMTVIKQSQDSFIRRHRTFFVGLFVLIPLLLIPALLFYSIMRSDPFKKRLQFHTTYDQNIGIVKGNRVSISGMPIGSVKKISLIREGCIDVIFEVDPEYHTFVKKDSKAMLNQKNLVVGDWEIQVTGGSDSARIADNGDTLVGDYSFRIDKLTGQITGMVDQVERIISQIGSGKGNIGKLLTDDTLFNDVQRIARNVNGITVQSTRMIKQVDSLLSALNKTGVMSLGLADTVASLMAMVQKSLVDVAVITDNVKKVSGNFMPMLDQVQDNLNQAEIMMRGLQKNWLMRQAVGKPEDRMLREAP
jgi:phospholipid/cholesterol/gamma-HCH transport system substrate-binding protein